LRRPGEPTAKEQAVDPRRFATRTHRLRIVKREERIAPGGGHGSGSNDDGGGPHVSEGNH
jgi:hypothetical protein